MKTYLTIFFAGAALIALAAGEPEKAPSSAPVSSFHPYTDEDIAKLKASMSEEEFNEMYTPEDIAVLQGTLETPGDMENLLGAQNSPQDQYTETIDALNKQAEALQQQPLPTLYEETPESSLKPKQSPDSSVSGAEQQEENDPWDIGQWLGDAKDSIVDGIEKVGGLIGDFLDECLEGMGIYDLIETIKRDLDKIWDPPDSDNPDSPDYGRPGTEHLGDVANGQIVDKWISWQPGVGGSQPKKYHPPHPIVPLRLSAAAGNPVSMVEKDSGSHGQSGGDGGTSGDASASHENEVGWNTAFSRSDKQRQLDNSVKEYNDWLNEYNGAVRAQASGDPLYQGKEYDQWIDICEDSLLYWYGEAGSLSSELGIPTPVPKPDTSKISQNSSPPPSPGTEPQISEGDPSAYAPPGAPGGSSGPYKSKPLPNGKYGLEDQNGKIIAEYDTPEAAEAAAKKKNAESASNYVPPTKKYAGKYKGTWTDRLWCDLQYVDCDKTTRTPITIDISSAGVMTFHCPLKIDPIKIAGSTFNGRAKLEQYSGSGGACNYRGYIPVHGTINSSGAIQGGTDTFICPSSAGGSARWEGSFTAKRIGEFLGGDLTLP